MRYEGIGAAHNPRTPEITYDARTPPHAFSVKLHGVTHLDALNNGLVSVVREAMQPAHISLWLGPVSPPRGSEGPERLRS